MSDSGSDSDYIECGDIRYRDLVAFHASFSMKNGTTIIFSPSEEVYDKWSHIPQSVKKEAGQWMKITSFWHPILLQRADCETTRWAVYIGLINANDSEELSMNQLHKIEILEAILQALEKGSLKKEQTKQVFRMSNKFHKYSTGVLDEALRWLERTGEPMIFRRILGLGHVQTCYMALSHIFNEFASYIQAMGTNMDRTLKKLRAQPSDWQIEKSEEMKIRGNENFQRKQYDDAVRFYSTAITFHPGNHIIYGNRALCYIRSKKYLKAVIDGKRATLIEPLWAKGHYRYCEALFCLGEVQKALEANLLAQNLCTDDADGIKDLEQQQHKFISETTAVLSKKSHGKRAESKNRADIVESRPKTGKPPHSKGSEVKMDTELQPGKSEWTCPVNLSKPTNSDFAGKAELSTAAAASAAKKKLKSKNQPEHENQKAAGSTAAVCEALRAAVQDAHTALTDMRSRNAEQAFSHALMSVENTSAKDLGLSSLDMLLLLFGRVVALTDIGQPEELSEAQRLLEKVKSFEERTFQCLVYYAIGKVYMKENRYAAALQQFSDSLQMVKNQITPGKLTWPLTKEVVRETQVDYFKELLENSVEFCKFPPAPDAVCRLDKCLAIKKEIYFTDPDFKGLIRICCCEKCIVEYHITCWKTLKTTSFFEKNEKDFLHEACLTPACGGRICHIRIFGATGLVKCKFEAAIIKPQAPQKPRVNQKCTSVKKLKSKEERRLRRKQRQQLFLGKQLITDDVLLEKEASACDSQQKAWLLYRDRVLLQISQHMELLRAESGVHVSALTHSLKPWLQLDWSRGNQVAGRMLSWQSEPPETLGQAVELLLERKNRVWARLLIQLLSSCLDINPKLLEWVCRLNDAGLNAARRFIERYTEQLQQLDLTLVLSFSPLQDVIIEKLGIAPEVFSSIGMTATEFLNQAADQDMRLFIWSLEEHRKEYACCQAMLDEYFDMMDGHFSILKKSDNESKNNSPMKTKNRGRKKKLKEPKGFIVLSGMRGATPREEWEQDFFDEDDSLSFLHPTDLFSVPDHLREHVAEFENQYNSTTHKSHYKKILDNNPDPTKESLYDYFAQILEEHGPLVAQDPLLVGELENFPPVAQLKIQEAGGFESFLLDSLRFIKMGRCIGLAKHAVSLQQAGHRTSLDDLDVIADPDYQSSSPPPIPSYLKEYLSVNAEIHPVLTYPRVLGSQLGQSSLFSDCAIGESGQDVSQAEVGNGLELDASELADGSVWETVGGFLKKHAALQTCPETMRSVAVNTEVHEPFESSHGDINKQEKRRKNLEEQISKMLNDCDRVDIRHKEDILSLEKDIQNIGVNIQVTNKELALFQQKLEEEVKKDQKEKKANQEVLKSLKLELEELVVEQESLSRNIRDQKSSYEAKLNDFLELSNQSAAERMSLEDEIKRYKDLLIKTARRSHAAQLSVVESCRDQSLYWLNKELADAKATLTKVEEAPRYPTPDLDVARNTWRANVQEVEKKISAAQVQYQDQLDEVKNGRRASELLPVSETNRPEAPAEPLSVSAQTSSTFSQQAASSAAATQAEGSAAPAQEALPSTVFDKAIERLALIFPDSTRSDLMRVIQELRWSCGGSLSSMSLQEVVGGASQLILDQQENLNSAQSSILLSGSQAQATPPLVTSAWQPLGPRRASYPNALNVEDPCIICHEDMSPGEIYVLECRHSFHKECIKSWLKEQSTCPTCRDHALLPEEFPMLPGRRRQAP
ncbi:hypothetical protein LDENG_00086200 [Lucifuga dentata]|nr:hypothetical protein LDENG_00086200 [Lucifuga dentata]